MKENAMLLALAVAIAAALAGSARADAPDDVGFVEATGGYGFQFGETEYLPQNTGGEFGHPLVNGYAVGGTAGLRLVSDLYLIGNYEFTSARTRDGEINNVIDDIDGKIQYHSAVVGARLAHRIGYGYAFGELGVGVLFPLETQLEFEYAPEMAALPTPVTGTGRRIDEYGVGVGAQGLFGYRVPLAETVYVSAAFKIKSFQTNNNGEQTEFDNFVTDFATMQPVSTTIEYSDEGPSQPSTYSVQDARLQLALGASF